MRAWFCLIWSNVGAYVLLDNFQKPYGGGFGALELERARAARAST